MSPLLMVPKSSSSFSKENLPILFFLGFFLTFFFGAGGGVGLATSFLRVGFTVCFLMGASAILSTWRVTVSMGVLTTAGCTFTMVSSSDVCGAIASTGPTTAVSLSLQLTADSRMMTTRQ